MVGSWLKKNKQNCIPLTAPSMKFLFFAAQGPTPTKEGRYKGRQGNYQAEKPQQHISTSHCWQASPIITWLTRQPCHREQKRVTITTYHFPHHMACKAALPQEAAKAKGHNNCPLLSTWLEKLHLPSPQPQQHNNNSSNNNNNNKKKKDKARGPVKQRGFR